MTFDPARQPRYSTPDGLVVAPNRTSSRVLPVPSAGVRRLELLDALRGFALFGMLMIDTRTIALFSLLLGIGFATRMRRADESPESTRRHVRRMSILLAMLGVFVAVAMPVLLQPVLDSDLAHDTRIAPWWSPLFAFGCLLIGVAIGRSGVLQGSIAHRRFWVRLLAATFAFSLVATLLPLLHHAAPLAQGMFCMAAFVLLFQQAGWRHWLRKLAPAGRMALSNCLAQTLFGLGLFYGIGLGVGVQLGLVSMVICSIAIFALQAAFSCRWLARYRFGPAEWLWRSLVCGKLQPMRFQPPACSAHCTGAEPVGPGRAAHEKRPRRAVVAEAALRLHPSPYFFAFLAAAFGAAALVAAALGAAAFLATGFAATLSALRFAALGSMAALNAAPGTNFGTFCAAILIFAPAWGLKPVRAARATCLKVPKPMSWTGSPFFTAATMEPVTVSRMRAASALLTLCAAAIFSTSSIRFN
jgi:uncharacterized protein